MNFSEKEIQNTIWELRENFEDLFDEFEIPESDLDLNPESFDPSDLCSEVFYERLNNIYSESIQSRLMSSESPFEDSGRSTIRADFLGQPLGVSGITVIELKKSSQTERQAFTELLGYSGALLNRCPGLTRKDIYNVLIAPNKSRILSEALIYSILVENKNVAIFELYFKDEADIKSMRFRPFVPDKQDFKLFVKEIFVPKNFDVVKITWGGEEGEWIPSPGESFEDYREILNGVASLASSYMNDMGVIGFVYSSQMWGELTRKLACPNSIIMVALNPFHAGIHKALVEEGSNCELINSKEIIYGLPLEMVFKGIHKSEHLDEELAGDFLEEISRLWNSSLYDIGLKSVNHSVLTVTRNSSQIDYGSFHWDDYQKNFMEDICCHHGEVFPSSVLRDLYLYYLEALFKDEKYRDLREKMIQTDALKSPLIRHFKSNFRLRDFLALLGFSGN